MTDPIATAREQTARVLATRELSCWEGEYSPEPEEYDDAHRRTTRAILEPDGPLAPLCAAYEAQLAEVLVARLSVHGPRQTKTLEQLAMAALNADAEVQRVTTGALADDGKITGPEAPAILEAQAKQRTAHDEFGAGLKRRCAK